jgi:hypothetical protein
MNPTPLAATLETVRSRCNAACAATLLRVARRHYVGFPSVTMEQLAKVVPRSTPDGLADVVAYLDRRGLLTAVAGPCGVELVLGAGPRGHYWRS